MMNKNGNFLCLSTKSFKNVVHFSEPFFAFEPLPFDEFFHLLVLVFLFPAKIIQNKRGKVHEIAFHKTTEEKIQF